MQGRQLWVWIVVSGSVVLPLAVVLFSLRYQSGLWSLVAFAGGTGAAVALVELSALIERRRPGASQVVSLRARSPRRRRHEYM